MKKIILLAVASAFFTLAIFAQAPSTNLPGNEQWNCQITFDNNMGPFNTLLYFDYPDSSTFTAHSAPNADKRIYGSFKATLARWMKKSPKKGIFMGITNGRIETNANGDSLFGVMHIPMIGTKNIRVIKFKDSIFGNIIDNKQNIGFISGIKSESGFEMDYQLLSEKIIDTLKTHIYDPALLETKQWKQFTKKLDKLSDQVLDDLEYFFGFSLHSQKLPFSHLNLFLFSKAPDMAAESDEKYLFLEEKSKETAYLNVTSFGGSAAEVDSIFNIILNNNYKKLIIDLRENSGGGLNSAIRFGNYLCPETLNAGYFVTNKWTKDHQYGQAIDFSDIETTKAVSTSGFIEELKNSPGKQLVISPGEKTFEGQVFLLTSGKTASTCEPIVYAMKQNKLATVVGQNTAGAMLSATIFQVQEKYYLFLPIADYYTADGKRLDQVGVLPNIEMDASEALDYVIGKY